MKKKFLAFLVTLMLLVGLVPAGVLPAAAETGFFELGPLTFINNDNPGAAVGGWEVGQGGLTMQTVRLAQRLVVEFSIEPVNEFQFIWAGNPSGWNQTENVMPSGRFLNIELADMTGWGYTATDNTGTIRIHHWFNDFAALGIISAVLEWGDSGGGGCACGSSCTCGASCECTPGNCACPPVDPVECEVCGEFDCICEPLGIPAEVIPDPAYIQEFNAGFSNEGWRMLSSDNRWMVPGDWGFSRMANFSQFSSYPDDEGSGYIAFKSIGGDADTGTNGATIASPNWDFGNNPAEDLYGYGYFEFRTKIADIGSPSAGVRSMFWIRGSHGVDFNSSDNDIRFMFNTTGNWINSADSGSVALEGSTSVNRALDFNPSKDFHTYGILWLPNKVEWWIDGAMVRQVNGDFSGGAVSIMLEQIVPGGTASPASDTSTVYDFVKFYEFDVSSIPVDKTALETLVETAETYTGSEYTSDSWSAFVTALNKAKSVLNDDAALQTEVNAAAAGLQAAIGALVPEGAILPVNLVGNYDFTQAGLPGWVNFGGAAREQGAGRNGSNAMVVTPGNAGANMPIGSLKANTSYYYAAWGKTEGTNANGITVGVQHLAPANPAQIYLIFDVGDYAYKSEFFTTAGTFNGVPEFIIWKDPGRDAKLYVDSMYLYEALIVSALPDKTFYETGEQLDLTGTVIDVFNTATLVYDRIGVTASDVQVTGFDSVTAGQKTVVLTYTSGGRSLSASFNVVVGTFADIKQGVLQPLIDEAESLDESEYSTLSWGLLSRALDRVKAVFNDDDATIDDVEKVAAVLQKAITKLLPSAVGNAPVSSPAVPEGLELNYEQNFNPSEWDLNTDWVTSPDADGTGKGWQVSNWQAGFNNFAARSNFDMYNSLPGFDGDGFISLRTVGTDNLPENGRLNPDIPWNSGEIANPHWSVNAGSEHLWGYGYYETRMKVAASGDSDTSKGVCASFFVQSANGDPMFEIDFEFLTNGLTGNARDPWLLSDDYGYVALAFHDSHPTHGRSYPVVYQRLDFNPASDFFTYGILWLPDRVEWWIEGVMVRVVTGNFERTGVRIAMNNWTGDPIWGGVIPEENAVTYYDFVRYYSVAEPGITTNELKEALEAAAELLGDVNTVLAKPRGTNMTANLWANALAAFVPRLEAFAEANEAWDGEETVEIDGIVFAAADVGSWITNVKNIYNLLNAIV